MRQWQEYVENSYGNGDHPVKENEIPELRASCFPIYDREFIERIEIDIYESTPHHYSYFLSTSLRMR